MPDTPNLSSALGEAVSQGREFLARVESVAGAVSAELAAHEQASRQWVGERQALKDEDRRLRDQLESVNATLAELRQAIHRVEEERDQIARDRDQARQGREAAERELTTTTAEVARLREQLGMVTKDRDILQADQIQWGLDREQLLTSEVRLKERASTLDADLANERAEHQALQARHAELTEQSNKLAADWVARRQALAAEIAAQNEEMEQVRKTIVENQERERRPVLSQPGSQPVVTTGDQNHQINSRLNALVGFSSVLLDERSHPLTPEERREYVRYLHDSAVKLGEAFRSITGSRAANVESNSPAVEHDRRPPDILVADNDAESRQRIEPFLKRAGYEVVYVDNGPRALEKASHLQPLAILIDGQLPPSGAPALVRELRKDPRTRDIPLVLLSGPNAPPLAIAESEVLIKPIDRQQLVQLMVRYDLMADSKRARKMPASVLVIDDDPQAIGLVKAILKPFNVRVSAVDSARAGIEQALRNKPDLVVLDLVMPGVDGFEVVAALRRDKELSRVPILVHTAKTLSAEDRQRLDGKVESIVEKAEFQPERFLELLLKRGERRKRAA
ncbi:MAG: response regulator [Chloroflexi bacterium]|nr:MAG: response regulator [Chloroflexota bacterium]